MKTDIQDLRTSASIYVLFSELISNVAFALFWAYCPMLPSLAPASPLG
jgi:hypothetical protein